MIKFNKKLYTFVLSFALLMAIAVPATAQSRFGGYMSTKKKVGIIGGGAAAGALVGGLLGGKKGAVIGGLLGAGGGAGYVYVEGKRQQDRYGEYDYYRYRRFNRRNFRR